MSGAAAPLLVDARGLRCPWPALRLARAMRGATAVRLVSDDPRAGEEVTALVEQHGWALILEKDGDVVQALVSRLP